MSEFVPIEIAKKLKEKGFKEKCLTYYDVVDNVGLLYNTQYTDDLSPCQYTDLLQSHNTDVTAYQSDDSEYCVDAPTISQVLDWLRKEKKLYIMPYNALSREYNIKWEFEIDDLNTSNIIYESRLIHKSYEEATIAGIEYVLDNLI